MTMIRNAFVSILLLSVLLIPATGLAAGAAEPVKSARSDFQYLEGRWVRPDGGYILELKDVRPDGSLTAAYYNPSPIRVFRAEAVKKNEKITLTVELRDVNYPGSIYTLIYDANSDRLRGKYFQAVEKRTFSIEFLRAK